MVVEWTTLSSGNRCTVKQVYGLPGKVIVALRVVAMVELKYRSPGGQEEQVGQPGPVHTDQDIRGAYHLQLLGERGPVVGEDCKKKQFYEKLKNGGW